MSDKITKQIRCVVSAINSNGEPDFYFVKVKCTPEEEENGLHYEAAKNSAIDNGYDPMLAYDEYDPAGHAIMDLFVWETASVTKI